MNLPAPLILASQSPRRKEILARLGFTFEIDPPQDINEAAYFTRHDPKTGAEVLAVDKALCIARKNPRAWVVAADTIVVCQGRVLGKPRDRADAVEMMKLLAGDSHEVFTGVAVVQGETVVSDLAATTVRFRTMTEAEIIWYLGQNDWQDKAGAYGIQGAAMAFVEKIDGCYYNVMGLPVTQSLMLFMKMAKLQKDKS